MGTVLLQQGRTEEALAPLQKAAELSQGDPLLHNSLGNALTKLGRLSEAEACYWRALTLDPNSSEARHNLGNVLKLSRMSEAERLSLGIFQKQPNQPDADFEKFDNYLFIVGAQKAGTTSLYSYLDQRPELVGGEIKEKSFFSLDSFLRRATNIIVPCFRLVPGMPAGSMRPRNISTTENARAAFTPLTRMQKSS